MATMENDRIDQMPSILKITRLSRESIKIHISDCLKACSTNKDIEIIIKSIAADMAKEAMKKITSLNSPFVAMDTLAAEDILKKRP